MLPSEPRETMTATNGNVLMLIDFQRDFLEPTGRLPVARDQIAPVLEAANLAVARARASGWPIVAVGNAFRPNDFLMNLLRRNASIAGSAGAEWDPRLPITGFAYFEKCEGSALANSALVDWLHEHQITTLNIAGLFAKACVAATARAAVAAGFRVHVVTDAIACSSNGSRRRALGKLEKNGVTGAALAAMSLPTPAAPA